MKISVVSSIEQPDFSELADELIPSVVSVSVIISRETINQPRAPQFPPGSPFEDFFKDFFERRGVPGVPPPRQRRSETAAGSGFIIDKPQKSVLVGIVRAHWLNRFAILVFLKANKFLSVKNL